MDAGRRHETAGSETKDGLLPRATAGASVSALAAVLSDPVPTGQCDVGRVMPCTGNELQCKRGAASLGNVELLEWATRLQNWAQTQT